MLPALKSNLALRSFFFAAAAVLVGACVDAQESYDDFRSRTSETRGVRPGQNGVDGGGSSGCKVDGPRALPAPGITLPAGSFVVTCLANLSNCDTKSALRFYATFTLTGDKLAGKVAPIKSEGRSGADIDSGPSFNFEATIGADGKFVSAPVLDGIVPATSNPISNRVLTTKGIIFDGQVMTSDFACAELGGLMSVDLGGGASADVPLEGNGDICLFTRVADASVKVDPPLSEFHCPLASARDRIDHVGAQELSPLIQRSGGDGARIAENRSIQR